MAPGDVTVFPLAQCQLAAQQATVAYRGLRAMRMMRGAMPSMPRKRKKVGFCVESSRLLNWVFEKFFYFSPTNFFQHFFHFSPTKVFFTKDFFIIHKFFSSSKFVKLQWWCMNRPFWSRGSCSVPDIWDRRSSSAKDDQTRPPEWCRPRKLSLELRFWL